LVAGGEADADPDEAEQKLYVFSDFGNFKRLN
jgi:hypothetical protein